MSESKSQTITTTTSYTSKKIIYSSSSDTVDQAYNIRSKFSSIHINGDKSKSFIQQRVERLYGPGALAQGFFISKRTKNRLSECSENGDLNGSFTNGHDMSTTTTTTTTYEAVSPKSPPASENSDSVNNIRQSASSPQLPVLRHLRPEFRAQLPILSPKRVPNNELNSNTLTATPTTTLIQIQKSPTVPLSLTNVSNGANANENNKENIIEIEIEKQCSKPVKLTDIITEDVPAAPQVVLPVTTNGNLKLNGTTTNGVKEQQLKDGHYFLKILKNEQDRLISLAVVAEKELEENLGKMTDEQLGYLRSASGKARLLVNQKMQQFEGLCHKNINKIEGEQFPTTPEDLQGFWDMVMLQVVQIDELFAELDRIRANNWIIEEKAKPEAKTSGKKLVVKKVVSAKAEAERKQREAARKKMLEDRRKAMRAKQQTDAEQQQSIEIFVPESS